VTVLLLIFAAGKCFGEVTDFVIVTLRITVVGRKAEAETLWTGIRVTVASFKVCVCTEVVITVCV
jgi:hypothetical protein